MTRLFPAAAIAAIVLVGQGAYAQAPSKATGSARPAFQSGSIEGRVLDEKQVPIADAMVSAIGRTTAAASTDRDGRYTLRDLPYGPYILSVHSRGFYKSNGRTIQLTTAKVSVPEVKLTRAVAGDDSADAEPPTTTQLAGFSMAAQPARPSAPPAEATDREGDFDDSSETAWRLRRLPRSILKEEEDAWSEEAAGADEQEPRWISASTAMVPIAFFADLPLSGQLNLMTIESFQRPGEIFGSNTARSVAFVSVNTEAAGGAWSMQGAMTQGDISSWIVAGSYKSIESANHAYELGLTYSTQRYDGGNATAVEAIRDSARNVGSIYGYDEWTLSPRLIFGYGTGYARYDYLGGPGVWSPRLSLTVPVDGFRIRALASQRALVPGAEEFAPSVTGMWLPPERTFSSLAADGRFIAERTRHVELSVERDLAPGITFAVRGFEQHTNDQLVEIFDAVPGRGELSVGHYFVATAGDVNARGWGVGLTHELAANVRGSVTYTAAAARWSSTSDVPLVPGVGIVPHGVERLHDIQTSVDAIIPQSSTRVFAAYRLNTAFRNDDLDWAMGPGASARFSVRVNQALPFMSFSNADWEALVDVRNAFREALAEASIYDEALAIKAPKRIVGGLMVKF